MTFTTRFAPSPTGPLHLGHAYSALLAFDLARAQGGRFLLRIEDIDKGRARTEWEAQIFDDLRWLGLDWPEPVMRQSERLDQYRAALEPLWQQGLLFACSCSRRDVRAAASAPQEGGDPVTGPDGIVYPGTCRDRDVRTGSSALPAGCALRLNMARAVARAAPLTFVEEGGETSRTDTVDPESAVRGIGDVVLARPDMGTSYHLSVVLDDAAQGVTHVVRGADLFEATGIHVILQRLLGLQTPIYHHHRLIRDDTGKRLAKRDDARALAKYRAEGASPNDIRRMVGLPPGQ
ncbi:tRNA glutamyl-Q(34) synthetase GluQRS [Sulfitobacter sp. D35]|uniref:tRNA glutamyl-Q(34) synthetase GluQRS n=1 Tax=Sulfitobacter sp. D35 TaxID=3083252 RepID=UPI00296ED220|nr:tRNA glutamyl-Q(34) synthetase GluQRS [Sulfitobacter sp. D35]MDW4497751.1 tRNA glutamyl-Q(34) synthetase GluQRS [Sulfitobacter sp. D35]